MASAVKSIVGFTMLVNPSSVNFCSVNFCAFIFVDPAAGLHAQGRNIADLGDPRFTHGQGGLVIMKDGVILGGIGVGGYPSGQADEDLSRVGLDAMNL
jgi:hypothetical protein